MLNIRPRTKVTKKEAAKIQKITKVFFDKFSPTFLASKCNIKKTTIQTQKSILKISPKSAHEYCLIKEVAEAGYTRESLRPDVLVWYGDE